MKRFAILAVLGAVALAVTLSVGAWGKGQGKAHPKKARGHTVTVVEHATTDATTNPGTGAGGIGDVLTWANDVFDASDANKVGSDQGYCIRVSSESYECNWTTFLPKGQITVEGPFYDSKDSTLAITGGTGRYRHVRGTMDLKSLATDGSKYQFVFHLNS
jgi:Allene oxide cyclase barrel like domain